MSTDNFMSFDDYFINFEWEDEDNDLMTCALLDILPVFGETTSSGEIILFGFTGSRSGEADVAEIGPFVIPSHGISPAGARSGSGSGYVIQDHICRQE
jgi:hypothetical protein